MLAHSHTVHGGMESQVLRSSTNRLVSWFIRYFFMMFKILRFLCGVFFRSKLDLLVKLEAGGEQISRSSSICPYVFECLKKIIFIDVLLFRASSTNKSHSSCESHCFYSKVSIDRRSVSLNFLVTGLGF